MESLYILIPLSVVLVFVIGVIFWWSLRSGQYDDMEGPAYRMLMDDRDASPRAASPGDKSTADESAADEAAAGKSAAGKSAAGKSAGGKSAGGKSAASGQPGQSPEQ